MFGASVAEGEMRFGLEEEGGVGARAYLEEGGQRCYLLLVWQEAWTSNPFARSKFLKGKLLYQRDEPHAPTFHACPFAITDGVVSVSFEAEEEVAGPASPPPRGLPRPFVPPSPARLSRPFGALTLCAGAYCAASRCLQARQLRLTRSPHTYTCRIHTSRPSTSVSVRVNCHKGGLERSSALQPQFSFLAVRGHLQYTIET